MMYQWTVNIKFCCRELRFAWGSFVKLSEKNQIIIKHSDAIAQSEVDIKCCPFCGATFNVDCIVEPVTNEQTVEVIYITCSRKQVGER